MPRRTRACATCRQKRIKCDATMPHCMMCTKFNRQCPGPTDAPLLFIDSSFYPSGKKPRKRPSPTKASDENEDGVYPSTAVTQIHAINEYVAGDRVKDMPRELAYVMLTHVSPRYILHEAFFANLVGFFCAEGRHVAGSVRRTPSWLYALPRIASSQNALSKNQDDGNALGLALRALTAAFSGIETRNVELLEYASGLYGAALRAQGMMLATGTKGLEVMGTSLVLSLFEAVVATTGSAYASHIVGAANMIESVLAKLPKPDGKMTGGPPGGPPPGMGRGGPPGMGGGGPPSGSGRGGRPGQRRESPPGGGGGPGPLLTNIFFHIRIQLAYVYLTCTDDRLRLDPVMKTVLLESCGWDFEYLPLNQQILRPLTQLTDLLYKESESPHGRTSTTYNTAKADVDTLWRQHESDTKGQRLYWTNHQIGHTDFRDPFTALNYAYFSACRILLSLLSQSNAEFDIPFRGSASPASTSSPVPSLSHASTSPSSSSASSSPTLGSSAPPTTDHFALILSVSWYLRIRDVGFAYLRLHLPLFVVAMYAPNEEQRRVARMIFSEWEGGSLRGIGTSALEKIREAESVDAITT